MACDVVHRPTNYCPEDYPCAHGVCAAQEIHFRYGTAHRVHCVCDEGWVGDKCAVCCDKNCHNGKCIMNNATNSTICKCPWGYNGELCNNKDTVAKDAQSSHLGTSLTAAVALVTVASLVILVYIWKKRIPISWKILSAKKPRWKWKESPQCAVEFDAFVSYRSVPADEHFVHTVLLPTLEGRHGLRLCVHHRDFIPGEAIANNILHAVQASHATILVISSDYVTSEWTRFEYQAAQLEMMKLRHRIIPIILDHPDNLVVEDPNLKFILETITFVRWPGLSDVKRLDKFWGDLTANFRNTGIDVKQ